MSKKAAEIARSIMRKDKSFMRLFEQRKQRAKMTMEIFVKNNSTNYVGKVLEIDNIGDGAIIEGTEHILQPGEAVNVCIWDERFIKVTEVEEIKLG